MQLRVVEETTVSATIDASARISDISNVLNVTRHTGSATVGSGVYGIRRLPLQWLGDALYSTRVV